MPLARAGFALFIGLYFLTGCSHPAMAAAPGAETIKVYYFPEEAETLAALDPSVLMREYAGYVTYADAQVADDAWNVARSDVAGNTDGFPDVRWGLIVQDEHGKTLASYFVDKWGTGGYADGHRVRFTGALRQWLRSRFVVFQ